MANFGPAQKAKLSLHASHLVSRVEANRDHLKITGVLFGAGMVYAAHTLSHASGNAAVGAGMVLTGVAGYAALKVLEHAKRLDAKVEQLAQATEQSLPAKNRVGLMDRDEASVVVARADPLVPDLVKALSGRRERGWDKALDPNYRPSLRRRGAG